MAGDIVGDAGTYYAAPYPLSVRRMLVCDAQCITYNHNMAAFGL